jgi:hypothetical protein
MKRCSASLSGYQSRRLPPHHSLLASELLRNGSEIQKPLHVS